jgi:hypothetical protein
VFFFLDENLKGRILLSSYSLVGLFMFVCKLKLRGKMMKIFKVYFFLSGFFKVKIAIFTEKSKVKISVKKNDCGCRTRA